MYLFRIELSIKTLSRYLLGNKTSTSKFSGSKEVRWGSGWL